MQLQTGVREHLMDLDEDEGQKDKTSERKRLKMHKLSLTCLCLDSKNEHAFTASKDGSIIKWCLKARKMLHKNDSIKQREAKEDAELRKRHHVKYINAIAISSDDRYLATGGWDKHVRIWATSDMTWLYTFTSHRQEITALAFRRGHPSLYSGSADRSVMIWSLEDEDNFCFVEALYGHESPITSMDSLRRERVLTSGGLDQSIRVWKIAEQAQTVFQSNHRSVDVARMIDDKTFISGGEDGAINVWTTMKRSPLLIHPKAHCKKDDESERTDGDLFSQKLSFWITSLAAIPTRKKPAKSDRSTKKKRKIDNDEEIIEYNLDSRDSENDGDEDEDTITNSEGTIALIASGSCDSKLRVWNLIKKAGQYKLEQRNSFDCPGFINDLQFTSDGTKVIAACGQEHRIGRWWRLGKTKNCMRVFDIDDVEG